MTEFGYLRYNREVIMGCVRLSGVRGDKTKIKKNTVKTENRRKNHEENLSTQEKTEEQGTRLP